MYYTVRVTSAHETDRLKAVDWVKQHPSFFVVLEHEDTNAHVQAMFSSSLPIKSVRNQFIYHFRDELKAYSELGNKFYSLKAITDTPEDVARFFRYLCKGDSEDQMPRILARHGLLFSDDKVIEEHLAYWAKNKEYKKRKKDSDKPHEVAWEKIKAAKIHGHERKAMAEILIKEYVAVDKPYNLHQLRSYVNLWSAKLDASSLDEQADIVAKLV